jgi:hypothetical protein
LKEQGGYMAYEYTIEFLALERIPSAEEVAGEARHVVYACGDEGECTIRDVRDEQLGKLQSFLNEMGSKGWELVQVLFNRNGAVSFWKRAIADLENRNT